MTLWICQTAQSRALQSMNICAYGKKNQPGCQGDPCWEKERRKILSAEWQLLKYAEERKKQRAVNIVS